MPTSYSPALTFGQEVGRLSLWLPEQRLSRWQWFYSSNWSGWAELRVLDYSMMQLTHSGKRQRWSIMSVLYLSVRSMVYDIRAVVGGVLTSNYARCATLQYRTLRMSTGLSWKYTDKAFLMTSLSILCMSLHIYCNHFLWPRTYSSSPVSLSNR
jgi:hypothetical protein